MPKILIKKTLGFGGADHGRLLCIEIEDEQGANVAIMIPHTLEAEFLVRFQAACLYAAKERGQPPDTRIENVLQPEQIDVGVTENHKIGLRMKLPIGMTLDLLLSDKAIADFQKALAELDAYRKAGGSSSSH